MTDKQVLCSYRLKEAEETLADAEKMLKEGFSPRSIVNRAYYSAFYATLALFLHADINIKTSKHAGVLSAFDKELVHRGKVDKSLSKILHKLFEARQESDYKDFVEVSHEQAVERVNQAKDFLNAVKTLIEGGELR